MTNKGLRLTVGLLVTAMLIEMAPVQAMASTTAESNKYMTTVSKSFAAGAHSAINETIVLNEARNMFIADIEGNNIPVVALGSEYYDMAIATNIDEYLSIRAEADKESEILGKLYKNGAATVLETLDGWYKIESGNVIGYVSADYVVVGDVQACEAASERVATINARTLNLRREASTTSAVLISLPSGAKATVVDESVEGWIGVQYSGKTGYISSQYATAETVYSYAESKEEEAARLAAEEAARQAAEAARLAAEEAARIEANRKQQYENAANKTYYPPTGTGGQAVVDYAMQFVGNPYVLGGSSLTNGIDCSNFVMRIYEAFGVSLPHHSYKLRFVGREVSASEIQPGDIICYEGHVSIYAGDGKCVHASNRKDGIKVSPKWNYTHVITIRRIFE